MRSWHLCFYPSRAAEPFRIACLVILRKLLQLVVKVEIQCTVSQLK